MHEAEALYGGLSASEDPGRRRCRRVGPETPRGAVLALLDPPQPDAVGDGEAEAEGVEGGDVEGDAESLHVGDESVALAAGALAELHR